MKTLDRKMKKNKPSAKNILKSVSNARFAVFVLIFAGLGALTLYFVTASPVGQPYTGDYSAPLPVSNYQYREKPYAHHSGEVALDFQTQNTEAPIYAVISGHIDFVKKSCSRDSSCDGSYGNRIILAGNDGLNYLYAHLNEVSVNNGDTVTAGAPMGKVGSTGNSTGRHLHFEITCGNPKIVPNGCQVGQHYPTSASCSGYVSGPYKFIEALDGSGIGKLKDDQGKPINRQYNSNRAPWSRYGGCTEQKVADPFPYGPEDGPSSGTGQQNPGNNDPTRPTAPTNLRLTSPAASNTLSIEWDAGYDNVGLSKYRIFLNGAVRGDTANASILKSDLLNLLSCTSYRVTVLSIDTSGNISDPKSSKNSGRSFEKTFTTTGKCPA